MSQRTRLAIFLAATMVVFAGAALIVQSVTAFDQTRDHASVRTNPWGTRAWRELLEASDVTTETWRRPLTALSDEVSCLVILDPTVAIEADEVEALAEWVAGGGRLVVAPFALRDGSALGGRHASASLERAVRPFGVRPSTGARAKVHAQPSAEVALTEDLSSVLVPTEGRLRVIGPEAADAGPTTVLLSDEDGHAVAVSVSYGGGEAIILAEAEMLSNAVLPQADNVVLAANLIFAGGVPETVHFDEYHHGLAASNEVFGGPEVDLRACRNTALALLAVALIYALGRSRRFGAAREQGAHVTRSSVDYVRALSAVYSRGGAASAAASMLAGRLRRSAAAAARLPASSQPETLAVALETRGLPGNEIAELFTRLEEADETMTEAELLTLAQQVTQYERMLD